MAKQNSANVDVTPSGSNVYTFPVVSDTLLGTKGPVFDAGSATADSKPKLTSGTNLTAAEAGALEYDGVNHYITNDTTSGRASNVAQQYFRLTAAGSTISTIANFFGANSNISLVSGGHYEIEIFCYFLKTTASTITWTLANTAAPTSQNIYYRQSVASGLVAPPGAATYLDGNYYNDATAARTFTTASLSTGVNHFAYFRVMLINSTGTSLKIQATATSGTITPGIGSYWTCRRLPAASTGTFAA